MNFVCKHPKSYGESRTHLTKLCSELITEHVGADAKVVDAGCGNRELQAFVKNYKGVDLIEGHNIEDSIPTGDVICFIDVLEHVDNLIKVLDNVDAKYCLIVSPIEHRKPDPDHRRRIHWQDIAYLTKWKMLSKWMWILQPRFWRLKTAFPFASPYAEEEITLWELEK